MSIRERLGQVPPKILKGACGFAFGEIPHPDFESRRDFLRFLAGLPLIIGLSGVGLSGCSSSSFEASEGFSKMTEAEQEELIAGLFSGRMQELLKTNGLTVKMVKDPFIERGYTDWRKTPFNLPYTLAFVGEESENYLKINPAKALELVEAYVKGGQDKEVREAISFYFNASGLPEFRGRRVDFTHLNSEEMEDLLSFLLISSMYGFEGYDRGEEQLEKVMKESPQEVSIYETISWLSHNLVISGLEAVAEGSQGRFSNLVRKIIDKLDFLASKGYYSSPAVLRSGEGFLYSYYLLNTLHGIVNGLSAEQIYFEGDSLENLDQVQTAELKGENLEVTFSSGEEVEVALPWKMKNLEKIGEGERVTVVDWEKGGVFRGYVLGIATEVLRFRPDKRVLVILAKVEEGGWRVVKYPLNFGEEGLKNISIFPREIGGYITSLNVPPPHLLPLIALGLYLGVRVGTFPFYASEAVSDVVDLRSIEEMMNELFSNSPWDERFLDEVNKQLHHLLKSALYFNDWPDVGKLLGNLSVGGGEEREVRMIKRGEGVRPLEMRDLSIRVKDGKIWVVGGDNHGYPLLDFLASPVYKAPAAPDLRSWMKEEEGGAPPIWVGVGVLTLLVLAAEPGLVGGVVKGRGEAVNIIRGLLRIISKIGKIFE